VREQALDQHIRAKKVRCRIVGSRRSAQRGLGGCSNFPLGGLHEQARTAAGTLLFSAFALAAVNINT
jgi:hypothetical protein